MTCAYPDLGTWGGRKPAEAETDAVAQAESLAWQTMLDLSAGRVTPCPVTVRPMFERQGWMSTWLTAPAGVWAGGDNELLWLPNDAILYSSLLGGALQTHRTLHLERPVTKIASITIDGTTLDPTLYRLDDQVVVRNDGQAWPITNDLTKTSGTGVFEVTYYRGYRPGSSFVWATGTLAAEFYLTFTGVKSRLPERVTTVTRQGVTFQLPATLFDDGRTGIREVDVVLRHYNPSGLRQQTVIASPDTVRLNPHRIGH